MARTWGRKGRPFRRAQAQCFAEEHICYLCGEPVDQTLANYRSPRARSVHHLVPPDIAPELANDRANMRLAHIGCNSKHGRGQYREPSSRASSTPRARGRTKGWRTRALVGVGGVVTVSNPDRDW
jgi:HNH endonuclease